MTVTNKFFRTLVFLIILSLFSCDKLINKEEENIYQIISLLTNTLNEESIIQPVFPPPPDGMKYEFTMKDSLKVYKYFYEQYTRRKIIAIEKKMSFINNIGLEVDSLVHRTNRLVSKLEKIDINKISLIKKDTLIYYTPKHKKESGNGFNDIDFLISFSEVIFNKKCSKAFLVVNITFEKLNNISTLIYLEKNDYNWEIKFEKTLTIS